MRQKCVTQKTGDQITDLLKLSMPRDLKEKIKIKPESGTIKISQSHDCVANDHHREKILVKKAVSSLVTWFFWPQILLLI